MALFLDQYADIIALRQALDNKQISVKELTQTLLGEIKHHANLNAFVDVQADLSLAQAEIAEQSIACGQEIGRASCRERV